MRYHESKIGAEGRDGGATGARRPVHGAHEGRVRRGALGIDRDRWVATLDMGPTVAAFFRYPICAYRVTEPNRHSVLGDGMTIRAT